MDYLEQGLSAYISVSEQTKNSSRLNRRQAKQKLMPSVAVIWLSFIQL